MFGKFFNQEELQAEFRKKADNSKLDLLLAGKSNVSEMQDCHHIIAQLYTRLRQVSLLLKEVAKTMIPAQRTSTSIQGNVETAQAKVAKHEYLFKQAESTLNSIMQFANFLPRHSDIHECLHSIDLETSKMSDTHARGHGKRSSSPKESIQSVEQSIQDVFRPPSARFGRAQRKSEMVSGDQTIL